MAEAKPKVLVKEKIADSGVELLRREFEVELGLEMSDDELRDRIGEFDGIVIRSATKLSADLIERGSRLKVIGRAGTGVDNVDVEAATKRGVVVVNAPESKSGEMPARWYLSNRRRSNVSAWANDINRVRTSALSSARVRPRLSGQVAK